MSRIFPALVALSLTTGAAFAGGPAFDLPILTFPTDGGTVSTSNCTSQVETKQLCN